MAAFRSAVRDWGADMLELDVHASADGRIVVIHDATVDRTTDGTGKVAEMTLAKLHKLDAGSWFGERFRGRRVPELEEVFALLAEYASPSPPAPLPGGEGSCPSERKASSGLLRDCASRLASAKRRRGRSSNTWRGPGLRWGRCRPNGGW